MFLGTHTPRLDDKGRLAFPARFRPELEEGLVICKGQDRCLYAFSNAEFDRFSGPLRNVPVTEVRARNFARILFASASPEKLDAQGRVTIAPPLRAYAGLSKDCVVIGADTRIEVWDSAAWQDYLDTAEQDYSDVVEAVLPGVF